MALVTTINNVMNIGLYCYMIVTSFFARERFVGLWNYNIRGGGYHFTLSLKNHNLHAWITIEHTQFLTQ